MTVAADTGATGPSLSSLLVDATERLGASGVPSPAHDALALLAYALGWDPGECRTAVARGDAIPAGFDAAGWALLVKRRAAREPLQHLLGRAAFRGIELEVGPGVFVPRPETEVVAGATIQAADDYLRERGPCLPVKVVDLCAGSGAIGIAVAMEALGVHVTLVEMSREAFAYLERNVAAQPNGGRRCRRLEPPVRPPWRRTARSRGRDSRPGHRALRARGGWARGSARHRGSSRPPPSPRRHVRHGARRRPGGGRQVHP